jgi:cellulose synthase/poly-beta-1,6-N-acetylglucosamine synthase-like glycosyltransferase
MSILIQGIFWGSVAAVGYAYAIYPVVIYLLSSCAGREPTPPKTADLPKISVLIAAHNEEAVIEQRIRDALKLDYPSAKLEIVIALDGCDDETARIAQQFCPRVKVLDYPNRSGKAATLNMAMQQISGEIALLSDANTAIDRAAARNLARWFADPNVGAVCGRLILTDPAGGTNVDSLYWRYETFLKQCEARLGGLLGANGAIYAIRRDLFQPISPRTIVDDLVIPLSAKLRTDCSIIYDRWAIGWERTPATVRDEFRRRTRIGAGGFQAIGMLWPLLNPRRGWIAFTFLSHKIIRWLGPFLLLGALGASAVLSASHFYRQMLLAQILFYSISVAIGWLPIRSGLPRVLRLGMMFTSMNAALLLGFIRWIFGKQQGVWQRTERAESIRRKAA